MKIRIGRRNGSNLYLQLANVPQDNDPCLGFISSPGVAALLVDAANAREVENLTTPERIVIHLQVEL